MLKKVFKISGFIILALLAVRLISVFLFPWYWVASESMDPTMPYDSHFFVNRYHYEFVKPKRGDIAIFYLTKNFLMRNGYTVLLLSQETLSLLKKGRSQ